MVVVERFSEISFGERSPNDCEEMWNKLFKKARTNRELVEEIREYLVGKELMTIEKRAFGTVPRVLQQQQFYLWS
ncbi:Protein of unknown function [Gryllus bimaculatus]|nr:Protein of unknown function [Gryllus bimaculatus]